ncbi:unnamed protein product [Amoebophrya sp. A25]|nr:unnamed protein product [Amoebophrya sp. A25]|eukprot:GSA25T00005951001.1
MKVGSASAAGKKNKGEHHQENPQAYNNFWPPPVGAALGKSKRQKTRQKQGRGRAEFSQQCSSRIFTTATRRFFFILVCRTSRSTRTRSTRKICRTSRRTRSTKTLSSPRK